MNVEEAIEYLYQLPDDVNSTAIDIALEPPDDGAESDRDDPSEDVVDVEENVMLLGPKLLAKPPHIELSNRNSRLEPCLSVSVPIDLQTQEEIADVTIQTRKSRKPPTKQTSQTRKTKKSPRKRTKHTYDWKKCELEQSSSGRQASEEEHRPKILNKWADEGLTPIDIFKYMWNEEIMELIKEETNRYCQQKFGRELNVTVDELYQVLGILLLSGYNKVPNRRMFWSRQADCRNLAVMQCGMSVNRFEDIIRCLHLVDNTKNPEQDKLFKIRPLFDHFNNLFKELADPLPSIWAVDEAMEPYYGKP